MPLTAQASDFLRELAAINATPVEKLPLNQGRKAFSNLERWFGEAPAIRSVQNHLLKGKVRTRIYSNHDSSESGHRLQPAIMYFHGGGWVLGDLETHDALCRRIAKDSRCTVIAVDYSLSPEAKFPTALEQCYLATQYFQQNAATFDLNPERFAVAGDSAGGNLAAAVALLARDRNDPVIDLQVLIYPVIEPNFNQKSYLDYAEGYGLSRDRMRWFWKQYLGDKTPNKYAIPCSADDLSCLPETHLVTAEFDVLRCEGEAYANQLRDAGVTVTNQRYDGNLHGFVHFAGIFDDGRKATLDISERCRRRLHR